MRHLVAVFSLVYGLSVYGLSRSMAADIAVVVGPDSPVEQLDQREVANIFLSKTNRYEDGSRVQALELSDDGLKSRFYYSISGKTLAQINSYWTTLIFTGRGTPPENHDSPDEIVDALKGDPRTISYLPRDGIPENLRIVYPPDDRPGRRGDHHRTRPAR